MVYILVILHILGFCCIVKSTKIEEKSKRVRYCALYVVLYTFTQEMPNMVFMQPDIPCLFSTHTWDECEGMLFMYSMCHRKRLHTIHDWQNDSRDPEPLLENVTRRIHEDVIRL